MTDRRKGALSEAERPVARRALRLARWFLPFLFVWLVLGIRHLDPQEFGVLSGPITGDAAMHVQGAWALAPPGLVRLTTYPRTGVELSLPQAEEAMLRAQDGSRFGFRGWVTIRPREEAWRTLHVASGGRGLSGVLLEATRSAAKGFEPMRQGLDPTARGALQRALSSALKERGVDLRRFELDSLDFLAVEAGSAREGAVDTRLLVVGLDGADWEILDPLLAQGRLPNLKRLIDDGARAKLLSISPMLSPVIWTTVATGVEPSRHGILDFLVNDADGGSRQPVTSAQRLSPTVWELLSRASIDVGVVGWWASWPADPIRGYLVSDRLAYQLFGFRADPDDSQGKTWPPGLYDEIRPLVVNPESVAWERVGEYLAGSRNRQQEFDEQERHLLDEFRTLLASGETYLAIGDQLRRRFSPRLEVIYFEGTDTVGHLFMPYRHPPLPGIDPQKIESFSQVVDRYYETADRFLGDLLADREGEWTVMVLSDHGFASDATRPRTTDSRIGHGAAADWHRRFGALVLSGANVRKGVRLEEATVYDVAPTILALFGQPVPRSWPGRVLGQALEAEFLERHPVRYTLEDPERRDAGSMAMIDPQAADLLDKLQSLGYISASGEAEGGDSLSARNNTGVALLAEGRFEDAEREFRAGLESNPGAAMLIANLGIALRLQGRLGEAAGWLEQAVGDPGSRRLAAHTLAQIRMEEGDLESAERYARQVLEAEPDAAEVRNTLGLTLERRGRLEEAREEYALAADLDPNAALPRSNLGNLAKRRGDLEQAERWYERAIEADPYFMGAYNNLALVYQEQGRMDRAIDLYGRALGKAPDNSVVLNNLASLYYARGEFDDARTLWQRAAAADTGYPSPLNNLAGLEINAGRLAEAERLLLRALELDPDYGDARINRAIILRSRGEVDAAREELTRAVTDPRTGQNGYLQLGFFELEQGRPAEAETVLREARLRGPDQPTLLNALGEACYRGGKLEEAASFWRASLAMEPNQARVREVLDSMFDDSE